MPIFLEAKMRYLILMDPWLKLNVTTMPLPIQPLREDCLLTNICKKILKNMEETFDIAHKYASLEDVIVVTPSIMPIIECMIILQKNIGV